MVHILNSGYMYFMLMYTEQLFEGSECPCAALYMEKNGMIQRIKNGGKPKQASNGVILAIMHKN